MNEMLRIRLRTSLLLLCAVSVGLSLLSVPVASAQGDGFQEALVENVQTQGWWDESGSLSKSEMDALVERWGPEFAFAYSNRSFDVAEDPNLSAAALLAQSSLERLQLAGEGTTTLLLVLADDAGGATTEFPYPNVVSSLRDFDRSDIAAAFGEAAATIAGQGNEVVPLAGTEAAQTGFFGSSAMFLILGGATGLLAAASVRSSRKKKARKVHTADSRTSTKVEIQEMSDLILDLEPRVTIANDLALKERYVAASGTYRDVLEQADQVTTGHEVADLRIEIAKARWKLDVIDAELEGRTPPPEPFRRDNSGSAWESTRGKGPDGTDSDDTDSDNTDSDDTD